MSCLGLKLQLTLYKAGFGFWNIASVPKTRSIEKEATFFLFFILLTILELSFFQKN